VGKLNRTWARGVSVKFAVSLGLTPHLGSEHVIALTNKGMFFASVFVSEPAVCLSLAHTLTFCFVLPTATTCIYNKKKQRQTSTAVLAARVMNIMDAVIPPFYLCVDASVYFSFPPHPSLSLSLSPPPYPPGPRSTGAD
jgi:hypothetical protein